MSDCFVDDGGCIVYESSLSLTCGSVFVTDDWDIFKWIDRVVRLVEEIVASGGSLFLSAPSVGVVGSSSLKATSLGKRLIDVALARRRINNLLIGALQHEFTLEAHPHVRLLLSFSLPADSLELWSVATSSEIEKHANHLNGEVARLRQVGRSETFKREVRMHRRHSEDSARGLKRYLRALSDKHAKLLVIRIDFGYHHDPVAHPIGPRVAPAILHAHRAQIVSFFQETFAAAQLGYIVKTEFGLYKGPHLHAVFILDGSKVRSDITIAAMLGDHWRLVVTAGQGTYFNCNRIKGRYLNAGVGLVDYRDPRDWLGAERMVEYITKVDYMVRVWAAGHRTLVKGWTPRQRTHKRGRPRTKFTGCELSDQ